MHNVQIIWEFWPFNYILPSFLRQFLTGYGINWVNTYLMDISVVPRTAWNFFWFIFAPFGFNPLFDFLWGLINLITNILYLPILILWNMPIYLIREVFRVSSIESFGWILFLTFMAVLGWLLFYL